MPGAREGNLITCDYDLYYLPRYETGHQCFRLQSESEYLILGRS